MKYNLCNVHLHLCIKQTLLSKATYSTFRLYIFYHYVCSQGNEPTTFCAANTMLYHWATGTLYTSWLSVQYNNKKLHVGFFFSTKVGTLWSVLYFYCNWQISAKKKKTREWEGMGVILLGFSPNFSVGLGRDEIFLWAWDGRGLKIHSRVTLYFTILSQKKESSWRHVLGGAKAWLALVPIATKQNNLMPFHLLSAVLNHWPGSFIAGTAPSFSIKWCSNPVLNWALFI